MTTEIDLDKLEQVARAAHDEGEKTGETEWYSVTGGQNIFATTKDLQLIAAATPQVVLELVRRLRAAEAPKALAVKNETGLPLAINLSGAEGCGVNTITVSRTLDTVPKPSLTSEKVIPLSVLEEIAQAHAESVPGPGGYPCSKSEKEAFKRAFLQRWMPKAIEAASGHNAALVSALQMLLNCDKHGSFGARVEAVNKAYAALAAAGVEVKP